MAKRKRKFTESQEDKTGKTKGAYVVGVIILAVAAGFMLGGSDTQKAETITAPASGSSGGEGSGENPDNLYFPIRQINDGIAHFYEYPSVSGKTIRFFILKSNDDIFRAAFDACDVCFREKKGYRQEGDLMVCNNCGMKFASNKINDVQGGCNPAPLERHVEDGDHKEVPLNAFTEDGFLVIKKSDIEGGVRYF